MHPSAAGTRRSADRPAADGVDREPARRASSPASRFISLPTKSASRSPSSRTCGSTSARRTRPQAAELVRVGDPVTLELGFGRCWAAWPLTGHGRQDRPVGRHRGLAAHSAKNSIVALYAVSTVQEEIGLRGDDQHLWHRAARRHRYRRDACHRLSHDRQEQEGDVALGGDQ